MKQLPVLLMTATFPQLARGYQDSRAALVRTERAIAGLLLGGGFLLGGTLALAAEPIVRLLFGPIRPRRPRAADAGAGCSAGVRELRRAALLHRARSGTLNLAFAAVMVVSTPG